MISKGELDSECVVHLTPARIAMSMLNDRYAKILLIRDPRDIMISQVFWFRSKIFFWPPDFLVSEKFCEMSFPEQLNYVVDFPKDYWGIREYSLMALEWMKDPNVFVCRFEHLIGLKGGGDQSQQKETIDALGRHLGYTLSSEEITYIQDHLFGETDTFREGKIGSWKNHFLLQHTELFKRVMGKELIELGYKDEQNS